jgi:hypothetical protein
LKDKYSKLTLFKVYGYECKSNEKLEMVNKVFPK